VQFAKTRDAALQIAHLAPIAVALKEMDQQKTDQRCNNLPFEFFEETFCKLLNFFAALTLGKPTLCPKSSGPLLGDRMAQ
jgi:hypothetical protein